MIPEERLRSRLKLLIKNKNSLRIVQREDFPFASLGTLARIRDGEFPKTVKLREAFDLRPMVVAPACIRCGGVPTHHLCKNKTRPLALQVYNDIIEDLKSREGNSFQKNIV